MDAQTLPIGTRDQTLSLDKRMHRRTLLKSLIAASLVGCHHDQREAQPLRIVVAGAGIVGASIAFHLAKAGASVTVIDKQAPASHASRGTFAWINATWAKQPRDYHRLAQDSVAYWGALQRSLALPIKWGGSLEWFDSGERQALLAEQIAEQMAWGEPARMLDSTDIADLEPNLEIEPGTRAAYSPNDGAVDPVLITHRLLEAAVKLGATVNYPCELLNIATTGGRLTAVDTSKGTIQADRLVLATGAAPELPARFAGVDIPQRSTPGVIAISKPLPELVNRIVVAPGVHIHQRHDGRIVLGEQDGAPETESHAARLHDRPNDFPLESIAQEHGERILDIARQFFPGMKNAEIEAAYIGWRPLPLDGHPVLGTTEARPDVYVAIMHSGVTLAPIVGQFVARELTEPVSIEQLDGYRPTRLFERIKRY